MLRKGKIVSKDILIFNFINDQKRKVKVQTIVQILCYSNIQGEGLVIGRIAWKWNFFAQNFNYLIDDYIYYGNKNNTRNLKKLLKNLIGGILLALFYNFT